MYDLRLHCPSTCLISGPSQSGKTVFVCKLLEEAEKLLENPACLQNVLFYYGHWQPIYDKLAKKGVHFFNHSPTKEEIKSLTEPFADSGGSLVIIDDFMQQIDADISYMFTVLSHHCNITLFLLSQNLFPKNPHFRDISLNATYILVFKNPRDSSQISAFARQFRPGNHKFIVQAYKDATMVPYSYIFFDNHQTTPDLIRVRSNIFADASPVKVWVPNT